jgi:hypothetical protein
MLARRCAPQTEWQYPSTLKAGVAELLAGAVFDDKAAVQFFDGPGRREATQSEKEPRAVEARGSAGLSGREVRGMRRPTQPNPMDT